MVARAIDDGNDRTRPNGMEIERAVGSRTEMKFSSRQTSPLHRARAPLNVAVAAVDRPTDRSIDRTRPNRTEPIAIDAAMPSSRSPPILNLLLLLTIDRVFFPCIRHAYDFLVSPGHTGTHRDTHTRTRDRDTQTYEFLVSPGLTGTHTHTNKHKHARPGRGCYDSTVCLVWVFSSEYRVGSRSRARIRVASGHPPAPTATGVRDDRDTATTV